MGYNLQDEFVIEEYIPGTEYTAEAIIRDGRVVFIMVAEKIRCYDEQVDANLTVTPPFDPAVSSLIAKFI